MLRFGPDRGPVLLVALPLFEEANRTRAFIVRILRLLGDRGYASALPDLPGQGESLKPTVEARLDHWRRAFKCAAAHAAAGRGLTGVLAFRGGALVDALTLAPARWRFAPLTGEELTREMHRVRAAAARNKPEGCAAIEIAGNLLSPELLRDLQVAIPHDTAGAPLRTVRLDTDPRPADRKLPGPPLWRRSEPAVDEALAAALTDDIAAWLSACAA